MKSQSDHKSVHRFVVLRLKVDQALGYGQSAKVDVNVPRTAAAFPRWTARASRCFRKAADLGSPD